MSRVLAAKCALSIRVDAMGDSPEPTIGLESRQMVRTHSCACSSPVNQGWWNSVRMHSGAHLCPQEG